MRSRRTVSPVSLAILPKLTTWDEVRGLLEKAEAVPAKDRTAEEQILTDLKRTLKEVCPQFNSSRDSVQKRSLKAYGAHGERAFQEQEARRLFCGFQLICSSLLGRNWKKRRPRELRQDCLLRALERSRAPELLPGVQAAFDEALRRKDGKFFEKLKKVIQRASGGQKSNLSMPALKYELIRNWTNPNCPLWLMTDAAVQQVLRYLTGGLPIKGPALKKELVRLKMQRYHRQPITGAAIGAKGRILQFQGYTYRVYIAPRMADVIIQLPESGMAIARPNRRCIIVDY